MLQTIIDRWTHAYYNIGIRYAFLATFAFVLFYIIWKNKMMHRKIQPKFPTNNDYFRDAFFSAVSIAIFSVTAVLTFFVITPYTNMYSDISEYGWAYYIFSIVWMFFLHDAYFYWSHRLMHHPFLFKWVHLTHHKSNNPSPWTAYAFHPLEAVLETAIVPIIAFSIPTHRTAIIAYMLFQIIYNIYGHLGYEIFPTNMHKHWLGKWFNTSVSHNMHHKYATQNYGLWTTIWDRTFGTMHHKYDEAYENATQKKTAA